MGQLNTETMIIPWAAVIALMVSLLVIRSFHSWVIPKGLGWLHRKLAIK
jgi:hypothetical protein